MIVTSIKPRLVLAPKGSSLLFSPHADDEVFGMGATVLNMSKDNTIIDCVIMTDGGLGGESIVRKEEARKSCLALGIRNCHFMDMQDKNLRTDTQTIMKVIKLIEEYKPQNIFFPSPLELHSDHRATAWIVWNALQSIGFKGDVYAYEVGNQSLANMFVDITDSMSKKLEIMRGYDSQIHQYPYIDIITAINRSRSYTFPQEVKYVEAFFHFPDMTSDLMAYFYDRKYQYQDDFTSFEMPLVSILIRTKNRPLLLKRALESVMKQTYQNVEIHIVNDGGEDISVVVETFDMLDIKLIHHHESKGRASSANVLLENIRGEYALFLDDDDTIDYNHIDTLIKIVVDNPNVFVTYSGVRTGEGLENKNTYNEAFDRGLLRYKNYIPIHALLFSRTLLDKGCKFDEQFEIYEDWDFWLQLSEHTTFQHSSKVTATYHINGDSGAGESKNTINREEWRLKLYDKWMKIWTPLEMYQTFKGLENLKSTKIHKLDKELQKLSKLLLNENNKINVLEQKNQKLQANKHNTEAIVETLINEKIALGDENYNDLHRGFRLLGTRGNEEECKILFEEVFDKSMSHEFWNWKYHGSAWRGICIEKDAKIIGHYNGMVRDILYFGKRKKALQPCDVMVSKPARGGFKKCSPFYSMVRTWGNMNVGLDKDFLMSYGFPNERTMRLGEKLGIYKQVDSINLLSWNIKSLEILSSITTDKYTLKSKMNPQVNSLWKEMSKDFREDIIGVRDASYLKRRYLTHPVHKYQVYTVNDSEGLVGIVVLRKTKHKMMLMDIIASKEYFPRVVNEALILTKSQRHETLSCWMTSSKSYLFDFYNVKIEKTDICVPTSNITKGFNPNKVMDKWFLMYGDSDFI